ncbi:hypothetical protein GGR42_001915 [Saonia flava]|uniref:Uncharacterized protein n=1 Tax=Saonia flava TaxID=523696 RepID=A0A846QZ23_9FLAO|nr:hypothetical protein [Saonia flava]NJB71453.1 hypothetical protein [Saonia flava]
MLPKFSSCVLFLWLINIHAQDKLEENSINYIRVSTSAEEIESKSVTAVYSDHLFLARDKNQDSYWFVGYSRNRVQYINGKVAPLQFAPGGSYVGKKIGSKKIQRLLRAINNSKSVLTVSDENLGEIVSRITTKKIKSILKKNHLYRDFKSFFSASQQTLFYHSLGQDSLSSYIEKRFKPTDTSIVTFPKSFEVAFYQNAFSVKLTGNTMNSALHPWAYYKTTVSDSLELHFEERKLNIDPKLSPFIKKRQIRKEKKLEYQLKYNLDINIAIEEILPSNMWNQPYTTIDGIIKDYVLWYYNEFKKHGGKLEIQK